MMNVYYFEWQKCQYIPDSVIGDFMPLKCLSRLLVLYMEPREFGSYSIPSFLSTPRKNLAIILSMSLGGICPGALSSPIEVKKSVITFLSLFVFVLVFLFNFSSNKNNSFFNCYHTKPFVWYDIFFLIVGILVQVCWQISASLSKFSRSSSTYS